ncbi:arad-like aldolase/epimerase [Wallemia mellicola]|uniref:Arad-like aldolase/epimerase n=1 Tax=Wallemia mellicola TaxID=1708541 RepID=A0A4T0SIR3_9BASI|nr:arad-like aldolase/epimerase [Wallemia mellicola]TIB97324.1 arad-like aldolase/epimerase [Wallemia mellicola]TIC09248.1 arad-like aldolase/epimerase [Wallemia mellicola]TIC25670.1 arad-like aldolase/epimerase [Wallemia mellicola]TIC51050.1 arad-like aldolase/epimerase [Wallemia mellicola]
MQNSTRSPLQTSANEDFKGFHIPPTPYEKITDKHVKREYIKERLALAFRVMAQNGLDEGAAGHLTVRDSLDGSTFWVNPFGVPFDTMTVTDLLRIDHTGAIIEGGRSDQMFYNEAAYVIHAAVHSARPDANAVCHSHSPYSKAFCAFSKPLSMVSQDACLFYNDHAVYETFGARGVVLKGEESKAIVRALGQNKALLMANHGVLTVGTTIESATFWFYTTLILLGMEKQCQVQLLVDAASKGNASPKIISQEAAQFTFDQTGNESVGWLDGNTLVCFLLYKRDSG